MSKQADQLTSDVNKYRKLLHDHFKNIKQKNEIKNNMNKPCIGIIFIIIVKVIYISQIRAQLGINDPEPRKCIENIFTHPLMISRFICLFMFISITPLVITITWCTLYKIFRLSKIYLVGHIPGILFLIYNTKLLQEEHPAYQTFLYQAFCYYGILLFLGIFMYLRYPSFKNLFVWNIGYEQIDYH